VKFFSFDNIVTVLRVVVAVPQAFSITFFGEWGDKSQVMLKRVS